MPATCPKCQSSSFTRERVTPINSPVSVLTLCCAECGAVMGLIESQTVGAGIKRVQSDLELAIKRLHASVRRIKQT